MVTTTRVNLNEFGSLVNNKNWAPCKSNWHVSISLIWKPSPCTFFGPLMIQILVAEFRPIYHWFPMNCPSPPNSFTNGPCPYYVDTACKRRKALGKHSTWEMPPQRPTNCFSKVPLHSPNCIPHWWWSMILLSCKNSLFPGRNLDNGLRQCDQSIETLRIM